MREDLLALTPEGLAALANVGLVKRAQKDLAQGAGPEVREEADGVVTGTFVDGTTVRLPRGMSLKEAGCSCKASAICRHRLAVVLAYQGQVVAVPSERVASPGSIADESIAARLGERTFERARALAEEGIVVDVLRPPGESPAARLPTCTVRFLAGADLAHVQCDCELRQECTHVALAVWAFRAADALNATAVAVTVQLGQRASTPQASALDSAVRLASEVLRTGVEGAAASLGQRFAVVRGGLEREGFIWMADSLERLEACVAAYHARSSRYHARVLSGILAELGARPRAATHGKGLPPASVLGVGETSETRLDLVRLVSLGARVEADGRDREAEVLLADPDSGMVLVMRKRWPTAEGQESPSGPQLGQRRLAGTFTLDGVARGQLVTRVARRRANRTVLLGDGRGGLTSLTPQTGDWSALPPSIFTRVADLRASWSARPPRLLRPPLLAEDVHAFSVTSAEPPVFLPGAQCLLAVVRDGNGDPLLVRRPFRAVSPAALDHLARALGGGYGPVRAISGEVRRVRGSFEIEPLAIVADRVVVPDLERDRCEMSTPTGAEPPAAGPLDAAITAGLGLLDEAAHQGLERAAPSLPDRLSAAARRARTVGLEDGAARLAAFGIGLGQARASAGSDWQDATQAWMDATITFSLLAEQL